MWSSHASSASSSENAQASPAPAPRRQDRPSNSSYNAGALSSAFATSQPASYIDTNATSALPVTTAHGTRRQHLDARASHPRQSNSAVEMYRPPPVMTLADLHLVRRTAEPQPHRFTQPSSESSTTVTSHSRVNTTDRRRRRGSGTDRRSGSDAASTDEEADDSAIVDELDMYCQTTALYTAPAFPPPVAAAAAAAAAEEEASSWLDVTARTDGGAVDQHVESTPAEVAPSFDTQDGNTIPVHRMASYSAPSPATASERSSASLSRYSPAPRHQHCSAPQNVCEQKLDRHATRDHGEEAGNTHPHAHRRTNRNNSNSNSSSSTDLSLGRHRYTYHRSPASLLLRDNEEPDHLASNTADARESEIRNRGDDTLARKGRDLPHPRRSKMPTAPEDSETEQRFGEGHDSMDQNKAFVASTSADVAKEEPSAAHARQTAPSAALPAPPPATDDDVGRRPSSAAVQPTGSYVQPTGSYVPPLMSDFDGELLDIIKRYYLRKQASLDSAAPLENHHSNPHGAAALAAPSSSTRPTSSAKVEETARSSNRPAQEHRINATHPVNNTNAAATMISAQQPQALPLQRDADQPPATTTAAVFASSAPMYPIVNTAAFRAQRVSNTDLESLSPHMLSQTIPSPPATAAPRGATVPFNMFAAADALHPSSRPGHPHQLLPSETTLSGGGRQEREGFVRGATLPSAAAAAAVGSSPSASLLRGGHVHSAAAPGLRERSGANATVRTSAETGGGSSGGAFGSGLASGLSLSALSSLPSYSSTSFVRAYVSDISLNLEPAIIVSALTAAVNIIVVAFLQHHVLDTRDHLGVFLIGSYMIFASYYMIYYFLERFSGSFRRIASQDKKFYIIGNLIKAGILVSITPFACVHLVKIIVFDAWEGNILRNLGCIYAIPDFISMVIVRRMRWSTWVHHACVVVFNYFSIMNNYQNENVCRCVVVYAAFSSFAYCVNVLLASRFLGVSVNVARVLSFVALVVYALCCAVNWAWQVYYLRRLLTNGHEHWTVYMYMFLISLVMWDDIVLNKWLLHHARNNAYAAAQHLQQHRLRQQQQQQQQQASPASFVSPGASAAATSAAMAGPAAATAGQPPPPPPPPQQQQPRPSPLFRSQEERLLSMSQPRIPPRAP